MKISEKTKAEEAIFAGVPPTSVIRVRSKSKGKQLGRREKRGESGTKIDWQRMGARSQFTQCQYNHEPVGSKAETEETVKELPQH